MSAESLWDVQKAIFGVLGGTGALTALLANGANSILDQVPANTMLPYVILGEAEALPLDTQATSGNEVTLTLHAYSQCEGMHEVKAIMAAMYDALHLASFAVENQVMVLCRCRGTSVSLEDDGVTRHGMQRFKIITEPA